MNLKNIILVFAIVFIKFNACSQSMKSYENQLLLLFEKLKFVDTDAQKDSINKIILTKFRNVLEKENSFDYEFKNIKNIGILKSENNLLKIYNWNLSYSTGNFKYFGFLQYYHKKSKKYIIYQLNDNSENIKNPEKALLSPKNWYGVLYYKIVYKKYKKHKYYTLLAWDGNDNFTNKKIIEVLYFTKNGDAIFGKPIIENNKRRVNRIIFEYAEQSKMLLRYDKKYDMIIWDHLSPSSPELKGQYRYYGPDFSYDGLFFNKTNWKFYSNIKVKNDK